MHRWRVDCAKERPAERGRLAENLDDSLKAKLKTCADW
jgi:hypothetical protein